MTTAVSVVSAFPAGPGDDATALVFEYMAATQAETGRPHPAGIGELPAVLQRECRNLPGVYRAPGALLIARCDGRPAGCVGLVSWSPERTAEVKRLYVRPDHRGQGIARTLMSHAHHHAAQRGLTKLVLDVLPSRTAVIGFYRRLGYAETGPYGTRSPAPLIYLARAVSRDDILG